MTSNDLLFYSKRCPHSIQLMQAIHSHDKLRGHFKEVCIDNPKYAIPPFVDRVPLIYLMATKTAIVDEAVDEYLQYIVSSKSKGQGGGQGQGPVELTGYNEVIGDNKGLSDHYGFINESDNLNMLNTRYEYINGDNISREALRQQEPQQSLDSMNVNRQTRFDENQYKDFLEKRDSDISDVYSRQKRV